MLKQEWYVGFDQSDNPNAPFENCVTRPNRDQAIQFADAKMDEGCRVKVWWDIVDCDQIRNGSLIDNIDQDQDQQIENDPWFYTKAMIFYIVVLALLSPLVYLIVIGK